MCRSADRSSGRRPRPTAIAGSAVVAAAVLSLVGCTSGDGPDETPSVVDPCGAIGASCTAAGAGSVAGGPELQGIGVVRGVDGSAELRVAFDDDRGVASAIVPRAAFIYSESVASDVALYDLAPSPGLEVVVSRGSDGTHAWFGVFTFDGKRLVPFPGPSEVMDPRTGMWRLLVGTKQGQVICDDGRVSIGSAPLGADYFACRDELRTDVTFRARSPE